MAKIISVCMQKGGVSKTTTAMNLGIGLARKGNRVLMVDFDPQGDLTACLGWRDRASLKFTVAEAMKAIIDEENVDPHTGILKNDEGVDLLPANINLSKRERALSCATNCETTLKKLLDKLSPEYDYIVIDCLPSLGIFTLNALTAADEVLIPMNADGLSFMALEAMLETIMFIRKNTNRKLRLSGVLLTMVRRNNTYTQDKVEEIRKVLNDSNVPIFNTYIPLSVAYQRSANAGKSVYVYDNVPKEYREAYELLIEEVLENERSACA